MSENLYISVADYKSLYGITDAAHDAVYDALIEAASRRIDRFCGRVFYAKAEEEYFDGNGRQLYFPLHRPVLAVAHLYRVNYDSAGAPILVEEITANEYHVYEQRVELEQWTTSGLYGGGQLFTLGQRNFRIDYTHGATAVPADVKTAAAMFANYFVSGNTLKAGSAYEQERIGDYMYRLGDVDTQLMTLGMPPDVKAILSGHRKMRIGGLGGG